LSGVHKSIENLTHPACDVHHVDLDRFTYEDSEDHWAGDTQPVFSGAGAGRVDSTSSTASSFTSIAKRSFLRLS